MTLLPLAFPDFQAAPDFQKPSLPLLTLCDPLQLCLSLLHTPEPTVPPTCSTPATLCCITRPPGPQPLHMKCSKHNSSFCLPTEPLCLWGPSSYQFTQRRRPESHGRLFTCPITYIQWLSLLCKVHYLQTSHIFYCVPHFSVGPKNFYKLSQQSHNQSHMSHSLPLHQPSDHSLLKVGIPSGYLFPSLKSFDGMPRLQDKVQNPWHVIKCLLRCGLCWLPSLVCALSSRFPIHQLCSLMCLSYACFSPLLGMYSLHLSNLTNTHAPWYFSLSVTSLQHLLRGLTVFLLPTHL